MQHNLCVVHSLQVWSNCCKYNGCWDDSILLHLTAKLWYCILSKTLQQLAETGQFCHCYTKQMTYTTL